MSSGVAPDHATPRVFVALMLPEVTAVELCSLQQRLDANCRAQGVAPRLTTQAQLHMTLAFLGEIEFERCSQVIEIVRAIAGDHAAVRLVPKALVALPKPRAARVLALEYEDPTGQLQGLVAELHDRLRHAGFALEDRRFRAHVTLARLRRPERIALAENALRLSPQPVHADRITVYRSELKPAGAEYHALGVADLPPVSVSGDT